MTKEFDCTTELGQLFHKKNTYIDWYEQLDKQRRDHVRV